MRRLGLCVIRFPVIINCGCHFPVSNTTASLTLSVMLRARQEIIQKFVLRFAKKKAVVTRAPSLFIRTVQHKYKFGNDHQRYIAQTTASRLMYALAAQSAPQVPTLHTQTHISDVLLFFCSFPPQNRFAKQLKDRFAVVLLLHDTYDQLYANMTILSEVREYILLNYNLMPITNNRLM